MRNRLIPTERFDPDTVVCEHPFGADAIFTNNTDRADFVEAQNFGEYCSYKYNIPTTIFDSRFQSITQLAAINSTKMFDYGIYFPTDRWVNPTTGSIVLIPDYSATTWTAAGVAVFSGAVLGQTKPARYPNHGQQMFDISNGVYGYNYETAKVKIIEGVLTKIPTGPGSNNLQEIIPIVEAERVRFFELLGYNPSTMSYRQGRDEMKFEIIPYYLGGRNSDFGGITSNGGNYNADGISWYGGRDLGFGNIYGTISDFISRGSTSRFQSYILENPSVNLEGATHKTQVQIKKTIKNKGWYSNFDHWGFAISQFNDLTLLSDFYSLLRTTIGTGNRNLAVGYSIAVEYYWYKRILKKVDFASVNDSLRITLTLNNDQGVNDSLIRTPIAIRLSKQEYDYLGDDLSVSSGAIMKLSEDDFIVLIDFGVTEVFISTTSAPEYYSLELPEIQNVALVGNNVTIDTNRPVRVVVFSKEIGASETTFSPIRRTTTLSLSTIINIDTADLSKDLIFAVVTTEKQATISQTYNFL